MRPSTLLTVLAAAGLGAAYPGMDKTLSEIQNMKRDDGSVKRDNSLLGDLKTLPDSQLTPVGKQIKSILQGGSTSPEDLTTVYIAPGSKNSAACKKDTCCIWSYIAADMKAAFKGTSGRCTDLARGAVRLGFHDAGTWSVNTGDKGGADGSFLLAGEISRSENKGLEEITTQTQAWYDKWKGYGITVADLIQMGANVATVVCPLGPRVRTYVGRKDSSAASPQGLLPLPSQDAPELIKLFGDKTISAAQLVALVGAHTTSQQRFVDTARAGDPQDSSPGVWDVAFYGQTTSSKSPERVFKFHSDVSLSQYSETKSTWNGFSGQLTGQLPWNTAYASAYIRLSLLGVNNLNNLTECTSVLPLPTVVFVAPDQALLDAFLQGALNKMKEAADKLLAGGSLLEIPGLSIITSLLEAVGGLVNGLLPRGRAISFKA